MARTKKQKQEKELTPRQVEMAEIQSIARADRSEGQKERLKQLRREENRDRFVRLAERRLDRCIKAMESLEACSDANNYEYTADESAAIISAVQSSAEHLALAFSPKESGVTKRSIIDPSWR